MVSPNTWQAMSHVEGLRNFFLNEDNYKDIKRPPGDISFQLVTRSGRLDRGELVHVYCISISCRFGELIRKLWNVKNFKAHVSPHEMLQAVVLCSKKKFQITEQVSAIYLLLDCFYWARDECVLMKKQIGRRRSISSLVPELPAHGIGRHQEENLFHCVQVGHAWQYFKAP